MPDLQLPSYLAETSRQVVEANLPTEGSIAWGSALAAVFVALTASANLHFVSRRLIQVGDKDAGDSIPSGSNSTGITEDSYGRGLFFSFLTREASAGVYTSCQEGVANYDVVIFLDQSTSLYHVDNQAATPLTIHGSVFRPSINNVYGGGFMKALILNKEPV